MPATVVNLQRRIRVDRRQFVEFADRLSAEVPEAGGRGFSVAFVSDRRMTKLNEFFRGKKLTTDVLSFPFAKDDFLGSDENTASEGSMDNVDFLGDIVISVEQAKRQAGENGLSLDAEIRQLILHGLLHLCGYDHETDSGEMDRRELQLRTSLSV